MSFIQLLLYVLTWHHAHVITLTIYQLIISLGHALSADLTYTSNHFLNFLAS